ncbi:hypothetical protein ACW3RF_004180, partial [Shigella sonnei]|uniref:hypothetical protein n=1 Tax=Shigella sonnei TaxID=624 RepID=UPI001C0A76A2
LIPKLLKDVPSIIITLSCKNSNIVIILADSNNSVNALSSLLPWLNDGPSGIPETKLSEKESMKKLGAVPK